MFAVLPWSADWPFGGWHLNLPSEPVMVLLAVGLLYEMWKIGVLRCFGMLRKNMLFWCSAVWIGWMAVSMLYSTAPLVSVKYWLVEAAQWFLFGLGFALFPELWRKSLPWFQYSLALVIIYTIIHHSLYHFRVDQAILAPMPFFPDHTMYAATLAFALFLPAAGKAKYLFWLILPALLISSGRAAALSAGVAGMVFLIWKFRKYPWCSAAIFMMFTGLLFCLWPKINAALHRDVSFLERLNRWDCSASMLQARPCTGFGPGTFPFGFLPFQKEEKMTRISTRIAIPERRPETYGRGGSAHSEYWQAAAEEGWPGLLIWSVMALMTLTIGFIISWKKNDRATLMITLALLTYFLHAFLNNFLHDGRLAMLVWGGIMAVGAHRLPAEESEILPGK